MIEIISLAVFDNAIYAVDNLGKYYSINLSNGKLLWTKQHNTPFISHIKVFDNKIFVIDGNNTLRCFSMVDGREIWNVATQLSFIKTNKKLSITIDSGFLLFSNSLGDIVKVDVETGKIIWFMPTQNTLVPYTTNFLETSDIVLKNNSLYFSNNFSKLYSLNLETGLLNWEQNINSALRPIIIDDILFTLSAEGYFIAININSGGIIRSNFILDKFLRISEFS